MQRPITRMVPLAAVCLIVMAVIGVAFAATASPNDPRPPSPDWMSCTAHAADDPNRVIAGCTAIIGSTDHRPELRAAALTLRGEAWLIRHDFGTAIVDFDQALLLKPDSYEAFDGRGDARSGESDFSGAIADYDQAIHLKPDNFRAINNRGNAWADKADSDRAPNEYGAAIVDFERAVLLRPTSGPAKNNLCWTKAISGGDLIHALAECNEAIELDPTESTFYISRSFVEFRLGYLTKAIADDDVAIKLSTRWPDAHYIRGLAEQRSGQQADGGADIAAALAIDPKITERYGFWGVRP